MCNNMIYDILYIPGAVEVSEPRNARVVMRVAEAGPCLF